MIEAWLPDLQEQGAVVIGGGLLGLEMAYALNKRGVPTTLLVRESQLGSHLLPQRAAELLEQKIHADGITVILGQEVSAYVSSDDKVLDGVQLTNGEIIATRMALCAVGVHPNTDLAEGALEIDAASGAIIVNDLLQTSQPDVYAAGGCALVNGIIAHNWSSSEQQGRIAALNMLGNTTAYGNYAPFDLQTYLYDLPFAYFGKQVAVSDEQAWVWHDSGTQFAQILVEDGRVTGATLIGEIASFAPTLWQIYKTQAAVELNQLVHFVTP
ncbi:MAG: FAD-dependent oxidoreductase, partial [Anaerolineae bacterium]|nr:FAD-dependent oxidoreductase [Anaerolineae bacterium]